MPGKKIDKNISVFHFTGMGVCRGGQEGALAPPPLVGQWYFFRLL